MISPQNVIRHELIGLDVLVSGASNPLHRGICGRIIDETKNLVVIMTLQGVKCVPKTHTRFQLHFGSRIVEIDGSVMALAPEKRINLHERKRIP